MQQNHQVVCTSYGGLLFPPSKSNIDPRDLERNRVIDQIFLSPLGRKGTEGGGALTEAAFRGRSAITRVDNGLRKAPSVTCPPRSEYRAEALVPQKYRRPEWPSQGPGQGIDPTKCGSRMITYFASPIFGPGDFTILT